MNFYGLLGEKLGHSISPEIHREVFDYINEEGAYKLFEVERDKLENFTEAVKLLKVKGFNVTIPYKQDIMKYLDEVDSNALDMGAVNTVKLQDGRLIGYNTDYLGFGYLFESRNIDLKEKTAVLLGNGGANRAAMQYLLNKGIGRVFIVSRNPKNDYKIDKVQVISYNDLKNIKGDILVNGTPVGMYPNVGVSPVSKDIIKNFDISVDLIYNPMETEFLKLGKELEKTVIGGLDMLIVQGIRAEEIWNDTKINDELIDKLHNKLKVKFEK